MKHQAKDLDAVDLSEAEFDALVRVYNINDGRDGGAAAAESLLRRAVSRAWVERRTVQSEIIPGQGYAEYYFMTDAGRDVVRRQLALPKQPPIRRRGE